MNNDDLKALLYGWSRKNPVLICCADPILAEVLNVTHPNVLLSWPTVQKQKKRHPEIKNHEYEIIPHLIETGLVIQDTHLSLIISQAHPVNLTPIYKVVLKATMLGDAIFVSSFHRISPRKLKRIRRRGKIIRDVEIETGTPD